MGGSHFDLFDEPGGKSSECSAWAVRIVVFPLRYLGMRKRATVTQRVARAARAARTSVESVRRIDLDGLMSHRCVCVYDIMVPKLQVGINGSSSSNELMLQGLGPNKRCLVQLSCSVDSKNHNTQNFVFKPLDVFMVYSLK